MNNLLAARSQFAVSMIFHIVFSCIGMAMPFFMIVAHWIWLKKGDPIYEKIARAWCRGIAIFFATGAVSGTVLSFELGMLWPNFMKHAGPIFGLPFSVEGGAFFIEAIAIGFYLYGWGKFNRWFHWASGLVVGISGVSSGILVVAANAWMNSPAGFQLIDGQYTNIDPVKAMFNDAWPSEATHMVIAAFAATGFAVAGIHAFMMLQKKNVVFHTKAFKIAAAFAMVAAIAQPISGDQSARGAARRQPAKLAAMEAHFKTGTNVPLYIGGIPDPKNDTIHYAIAIPGGLSFMVNGNVNSEVKGLDQIPEGDRPPTSVVHYAFQTMVAMGMGMFLLGLLYGIARIKKTQWLTQKWFLTLFACATPAGFIAVEAGWTVTEVGRQPWVIQGVMRTSEAVTAMPGIIYTFYLFTFVYFTLGILVCLMLWRQIRLVSIVPDLVPVISLPKKIPL